VSNRYLGPGGAGATTSLCCQRARFSSAPSPRRQPVVPGPSYVAAPLARTISFAPHPLQPWPGPEPRHGPGGSEQSRTGPQPTHQWRGFHTCRLKGRAGEAGRRTASFTCSLATLMRSRPSFSKSSDRFSTASSHGFVAVLSCQRHALVKTHAILWRGRRGRGMRGVAVPRRRR
jgi:hypothetical protein